MLAPIRPRPTNPICIPESLLSGWFVLVGRAGAGRGRRDEVRSAAERAPRRGPPRARPGRAPGRRGGPAGSAGRGTRSTRSRPAAWASISRPNVYGQPGIGRSIGMVRRELEEPADRRAALVELAGRVEEARPVAGGRRAARRVARASPDRVAIAASRAAVGAMNAWMREVGVGAAPGEVPARARRRASGRRPRSGAAARRRRG